MKLIVNSEQARILRAAGYTSDLEIVDILPPFATPEVIALAEYNRGVNTMTHKTDAFATAHIAATLVDGGVFTLHKSSDGGHTIEIEAPPITLRSPRPGRWVASFTYNQEGFSSHAIQVEINNGTAQDALNKLRDTLRDKASQLSNGIKIIK